MSQSVGAARLHCRPREAERRGASGAVFFRPGAGLAGIKLQKRACSRRAALRGPGAGWRTLRDGARSRCSAQAAPRRGHAVGLANACNTPPAAAPRRRCVRRAPGRAASAACCRRGAETRLAGAPVRRAGRLILRGPDRLRTDANAPRVPRPPPSRRAEVQPVVGAAQVRGGQAVRALR